MENKPPLFQNPLSDGGSFFWSGNKRNTTAILLFHGFTATTVEVRTMAKFLNTRGYTVAGPLLPGHGVSPDELNRVNFRDWIGAAEDAFQQLSGKYKHIFIMGESMGGLLSLWLSAIHPEIMGLMIFAPALNIPNLWQSQLIWPFVKYLYKKNIDLTSTWQGFNVVPLRAAAQLYQFQQIIKKQLIKIHQPLLIFQGKLDTTINPMSAVEVLEAASSKEKELIWLDQSSHCILLDDQMDIVTKLCLDFIQQYSAE